LPRRGLPPPTPDLLLPTRGTLRMPSTWPPSGRRQRRRIAAFAAVEQLLGVLAAERARPWWRRLVG
jgi:hypothetical protein